LMQAVMTSFRAREETVNLDIGFPFPLALIFEHG